MGKKVGGALLGAVVAAGLAFVTGGASLMVGGSYFAAGTLGRVFLTNAVLGFLAGALAPKPSSTQQLSGRTVASRSAVASRKIAYGHVKTSGTIVFMESTGTDNKYLHQITTLAGHEISEIVSVYLGDTVEQTNLSDGVEVGASNTLASYADITGHFGSSDQTADSNLVSRTSMTSDHRLRGIAYVYTRFKYDQDKYPSGVPNVSAVIKGKAVYDPRSETTGYSNNAALCILDYLTDTTYGLGATTSEIDYASFITAANICDEDVTLDAGGTEKRYTINGLIDTNSTPSEILQQMASACAGTVYYSNGKWHLKAGAYITPTDTLTNDDFVSAIEITTRVTNQSNFNAVKGVFVSPDNNWQPVDFPPVVSSTFENEDGGEQRYADMTMPFTTSNSMAQRLAKIALYRNREQLTVSVSCKLTAFKYDIGDTLMITNERMGWTNKVFEVIGWQYGEGDTPSVALSLKETSTTVYDWSATDESALTANNTTLPDAFNVGSIQNLDISQLSSVLDDGAYQSSVVVTWDAPADGFVTGYEVQWKRGSADNDYGTLASATVTKDYGLITGAVDLTYDWGFVDEAILGEELYFNSALTTDRQFVINNVLTTDYTIRVRAINALGVRSAWETDGISPLADTSPPSVPTNMNAQGGFRQIEITWLNPSDADYDVTKVFRNTTNNSASAVYVGSTRGTSYTDTGLGINETYYYWTEALDRTGNESGLSYGVSATTAFVDSADFSAEVLNLFAEAGAYGIEPVSSLPATGDFDGQIKYDTTANKLYRWDESTSSWTDDIFSITAGSVDLASFASGIEPVSIVSSLPSPTGYTGAKVVFLTTDNKLYRYTGTEWTSATSATDISGTINEDNFPSDLRPIEIVSSLPTTGLFDGRQVYLTTDKKVYRYNGTSWTASIATSDLSGTIQDAQIAGMAASKLAGEIQGTQISDGAISTEKLAANSITSGKIAAGTIQASDIAAGTITGDKIAANTITGDEIAANTITAGEIATGAIAADEIAASAITSDKLSANAVTAGKIAAGAVSADAIAANTITGDKIAASTIQGDKIAANTITGGLLATSGIITDAAQIGDAVIENVAIKNGAITNAKISGAIASTDYVSGSTGWQIDKAGTAEFNDVTIRGSIEASVLDSDSLIIKTNGSNYAPFSFTDGNSYTLGSGGGTNATIYLNTFSAPDLGTGFDEHRLASNTTKVHLTGFGCGYYFYNFGAVSISLQVSYDGGSYQTIASGSQQGSSVSISTSFTPDPSWDTIRFRLVGSNIMSVSISAIVINGG